MVRRDEALRLIRHELKAAATRLADNILSIGVS